MQTFRIVGGPWYTNIGCDTSFKPIYNDPYEDCVGRKSPDSLDIHIYLGAQAQYKPEAHLRQAEGREAAWERERSEQHEAQSVFFSEWTTAEGAYVYSPEVYINLWKDLPMQAGAK